jgi:hypothetical protein
MMLQVGKHRAGNFLDGVEEQEFPIPDRKRFLEAE